MMEYRGLNQYEFASKLKGVYQPQVSKWVRGTAKPSARSFAKIASVLECVVIVAGDGEVTYVDPIRISIEPLPVTNVEEFIKEKQ